MTPQEWSELSDTEKLLAMIERAKELNKHATSSIMKTSDELQWEQQLEGQKK